MASWLSRIAGTLADAFRIGRGTVDAAGLTASRTHELQDQDGVLAHLSDIPAALDYLEPGTTTTEELIDELIAKGWMAGPPLPDPPVNTVAPVASGAGSVGVTLSCTTGTWTNSPTSYSYQWYEDIASVWTEIVGETNNTFEPDHAADYRCEVVATNAGGDSAPAPSNTQTVTSGGGSGYIGWQGPADDVTPLSDDRVWVYKVVLTEAANLDEFFIYKQTGAGGPEVKGLIFEDDAGEPGDLVAATAIVSCPAGPTWFSIPISGSLPPGTYWIGLVTGGVYTPVGATSSRPGEEIKRAEGYPYPGWNTAWPGTAGTVTPRSLAIYVTYTT